MVRTTEGMRGITWERAEALIQAGEEAYSTADVQRILGFCADDIVVRYADFSEMRGKAALERFLQARFARQRHYHPHKRVRSVSGNVIGSEWEGEWEDAQSGTAMQGRGMEFLTMRDDQIAVWDAVFNAWPKDGAPATPIA